MKFAAEIEFTKKDSVIKFIDGIVVSALYLLGNYMVGVEYDVFNPNVAESDFIKGLPDGHYRAFMLGELQLEEAGDPEVGMSEPSYIFLVDDKDIEVYQLVIDKTSRKPYQKKVQKEDDNAGTSRQERGDK